MPCLKEAAKKHGEARVVMHSSGAAFRFYEEGSRQPKSLDAQYFGTVKLVGDGGGDKFKARFRRYQQSKLAQYVALATFGATRLGIVQIPPKNHRCHLNISPSPHQLV